MQYSTDPLKGCRALVIGLGLSGQSAARFLLNRGAHVVGVDRNEELLNHPKIAELIHSGMHALHESQPCNMSKFNLVVVSPGIPSTQTHYQQALAAGIEVIGEAELACREMNKKCVGVTGTNGKTTVTLLTAHILKTAGKKTLALGNVGLPLTSALDDAGNTGIDVFVVELSSFQLETLAQYFLDAGVILNITPDHLDRYGSMESYASAKFRLAELIKDGGKLFIEEHCLRQYHTLFGSRTYSAYGYSKDSFIYTDKTTVYRDGKAAFTLPGEFCGKSSHDVENILAAYGLCSELGVSPEIFLEGLNTFKKPPHRIEFVRSLSGMHFYDDSKGTNIDAVIKAVNSIEGSIILIAGGVDKGAAYTPWVAAFGNKVKSICAIGQSAEKIQGDLGQHIPVQRFATLNDAVVHAAQIAQEGDSILLSPGCSSYDMFKDYAHRGEEFQRIVNTL
jgi:UDP-N-acetylmuramoylalanine--D-glutamate ligase